MGGYRDKAIQLRSYRGLISVDRDLKVIILPNVLDPGHDVPDGRLTLKLKSYFDLDPRVVD